MVLGKELRQAPANELIPSASNPPRRRRKYKGPDIGWPVSDDVATSPRSTARLNDSSGHAAGDALLCELAGALTRRLRGYDLIMRWGGDEFVVALSHAGSESARRVLREVEGDFRDRTGHSFDIGVAEIGPDGGAEELVARADADLYARRRGRERWGESRQKRQGRSLQSPA